jgi:ATP-dependent DNA ligase
MTKAVWLRPEAVAQIEFLEWTEADRLRHSKFVGLREDKNLRSVGK